MIFLFAPFLFQSGVVTDIVSTSEGAEDNNPLGLRCFPD